MIVKHSPFNLSRIATGLAVAGSIATAAPVVVAQDSAMLEEIIVTARKMYEPLQTVPVAVSAFTGETIDNLVMRDIREMEGFIPNLVIDSVSVSPAGASIYIRGVGTQEVERSFDPAVGVIVDGVPLSFVNGSMANTFDYSSIEVLRGPQGTLFGRNTTGGVININRTTPTGELGLKYELTGGNDDRVDFNGVLNFPIISEKLAGKLGYATQQDGGLRENDGERVGDADNEEITATLLWTPADSFEALFTYVNYEDKNDGVLLQNITSLNLDNPVNPAPEVPCVLPEVVFGQTCGDDVDDLEEFTQDWYNPIDFQSDSYSLSMNWETSIGTITSITGYQEVDEEVKTDFDGTSLNFFHANRLQQSEQTSTELRFASNEEVSENIDFVVGLFWLEDEYQLEQRTSIGAFGGPADAVFQNPFADHQRETWSVFGEVHFALGEKWNLTLGGRYTDEEKELTSEGSVGGAAFAGFLPDGGDDLYVFGTPIFIPTSAAYGKEDWQEFTPKVGVDYSVNDDVMTYLSYSEGFRSGGFNGRNNEPDNIGPFDPEFVENYELGMKGDFADNTVRLNLAAFYLDYSDKQEEVIEPDDFGGSNTVVRNASTVNSMGVEAEFTWVANQNFQLNASLGWLDSEYDDFVADITGDGIVTDNSDLELRRAPEWNGSVNGIYTVQLGPGSLTAFLGYRYTDEYWVEIRNDARGLIEDRGVWDATVSYEWGWSDDRVVKITAFGRDLTDEVGNNSAVIIPGTIAFGAIAGGTEYGLQISGNF
ncbi:MAG: TonB-dependent receptor [Halioglobus sp.]